MTRAGVVELDVDGADAVDLRDLLATDITQCWHVIPVTTTWVRNGASTVMVAS